LKQKNQLLIHDSEVSFEISWEVGFTGSHYGVVTSRQCLTGYFLAYPGTASGKLEEKSPGLLIRKAVYSDA